MKSQLMILVLAGLVAFAHCLPSALREREELDETNDKPSTRRVPLFQEFESELEPLFGFDDDEHEPLNFFRLYFPEFKNPFPGIMDGLQNTMKLLKEQMSRIPQPGFPTSLGRIPENANKTSTTKVIGGHIVTINETTYRNDDPNLTFVFKIRTVDAEPENATNIFVKGDDNSDEAGNDGGEQTETVTVSATRLNDKTSERSVETVEEPGNNEIPDNQVETLQA